jgi:signal transduction histidine kinase
MQAEAEKLAATGRMAARVAHEINNPLAGIKNAYRLVRDAVPEDHPDRDMVERIEREITRISNIVQQMYTLYSPKADQITEAVVAHVVQDVLSMLEPMRRESEVQFDATGASSGLSVRVPEGGLHQIVFNLLTNAVEASPSGGVVTIAVALDESRPDMVRISVRDQGKGIPPDIQPKIFEPFFTSKTDEYMKGGLGLGLSVVRTVVEASGGRIEFDSTTGQGTTFCVFLPSYVKALER